VDEVGTFAPTLAVRRHRIRGDVALPERHVAVGYLVLTGSCAHPRTLDVRALFALS
jgi:hypothetical protein